MSLLKPLGKLAQKILKLRRESLGSFGVFKEKDLCRISNVQSKPLDTYGSISPLVLLDLWLILGPDRRREILLASFQRNIPQPLVFFIKQDDCSARLNVKWRRSMLDGVVYNQDNPVVGYGTLFGDGKDGTTDLDGVEERDLVG
jgi:hypothetical protein